MGLLLQCEKNSGNWPQGNLTSFKRCLMVDVSCTSLLHVGIEPCGLMVYRLNLTIFCRWFHCAVGSGVGVLPRPSTMGKETAAL
jgi:hypothetical protein